MELVKYTPEEQAQIDADKKLPHVAIVLLAQLTFTHTFQPEVSKVLERGMASVKERADRAKMIILNTSISTNTIDMNEGPYLSVMILCQWAEIEKIEEAQRRAFLAGGGSGRRGA
jgi:hypothetical protein